MVLTLGISFKDGDVWAKKKKTSVYRKVGLSEVLGAVCMPYWRIDANEQTVQTGSSPMLTGQMHRA